MNLFPSIQPPDLVEATDLPLYREAAWDYKENRPIYQNGSPVFVEGREAVLVWAWNALHVSRCRHDVFTWDYGSELDSLIGKPYSDDLKQSEAVRYVQECLLVNPYITGVNDCQVSFLDDALKLSCTVETVYGDVNLNV